MERQKILAWIAIICVAFAFLIFPRMQSENYVDEWAYLYIGKHWDAQHALYKDLPDNKGPALYLFYKLLDAIFGSNYLAWKFVYLALVAGCAISIFFITKKALGDKEGMAAFAAFLVLAANPSLVILHASETLGLFFLLASIALLMIGELGVVSGIFFALAMVTNSIFIPGIASLVVCFLGGWAKPGKYFAVGMLLVLIVFGTYVATGIGFENFVNYYILYNSGHTRFKYFEISNIIGKIGPDVAIWIAISIALVVSRDTRMQFFGLVLAPFAVIPIFVTSTYYTTHYLVAAIPFFAAGGAMAYRALEKWQAWRAPIFFAVLLAAYGVFGYQMNDAGNFENGKRPLADYERQVIPSLIPEAINSRKLYCPLLDDVKYYEFLNASYNGKFFFDVSKYTSNKYVLDRLGEDIESVKKAEYVLTSETLDVKRESYYAIPEKTLEAIQKGFSCRELPYKGFLEKNITFCVRK